MKGVMKILLMTPRGENGVAEFTGYSLRGVTTTASQNENHSRLAHIHTLQVFIARK
jgi:hypothetical protein